MQEHQQNPGSGVNASKGKALGSDDRQRMSAASSDLDVDNEDVIVDSDDDELEEDDSRSISSSNNISSSSTSSGQEVESLLPLLAGPLVPDPVFFCSVEAPSPSKEKILEQGLKQLQREDPSLNVIVHIILFLLFSMRLHMPLTLVQLSFIVFFAAKGQN